MAELHVDVKPRLAASAYICAPFDEGIEALANEGYGVISLEENAQLRIWKGTSAPISRKGNWTKEGVLYVPGKGIFLTKNSPIMANAKEATGSHRNGRDFYLTPEQVEQALPGSVQLPERLIPTNKFKDNEITAYAFGEYAEAYGDLLEKDAGGMPICMRVHLAPTMREKPFATQVWFLGLDGLDLFDCSRRPLSSPYRLRGVHVFDGADI